jgi:L-rhamnono-1,4-lactonase
MSRFLAESLWARMRGDRLRAAPSSDTSSTKPEAAGNRTSCKETTSGQRASQCKFPWLISTRVPTCPEILLARVTSLRGGQILRLSTPTPPPCDSGPTMPSTSSSDHKIIDAHIHLYTSSHLSTLAWTPSLPPSHVLNRQNSVSEYRCATTSSANRLRGFIFIESDRVSSLSDDGWEYTIVEIFYLSRIARGEPLKGDGHDAADKNLVLGIVPWAPLPAGPVAVERYMTLAKTQCGHEEIWSKIKGVRYLVQDKPSGVMLQPRFISSLRWLGEQGLSFDLGIDARSGGIWQLREACEMLRLLYPANGEADGGRGPGKKEKVKIVINHFCKPDLQLKLADVIGGHPNHLEWKRCMEEMARFPGTFMKLSGFFSELPPQVWEDPSWLDNLVDTLKPWTDVVFEAFGPSRVMFGSDWPVCNVGGPGEELSWTYWYDIVEAMLSAWNLSDAEKSMVWAGTARLAYNIDIL